MKTKLTAAILGLGMLGVADLAIADNFAASFNGFQAVPTLSLPGSTAKATFSVNNTNSAINYTLTYNTAGDPVTQVHVHLGRPRTAGGVVAFLCSNLGNAPAGTPGCGAVGASSGTVIGTLTADSIVGPSAQGIAAGDFAEVLAGLRRLIPNFYGCVHTNGFPGGSIRGAVFRSFGGNDD